MHRTILATLAPLAWTALAHGQDPFEGVTMISPLNSSDAYLMDMDGTILKTWHGANRPASFAYLLADGSILRPYKDSGGQFSGGGVGPSDPVWTYGGPGWYAGQTQCAAYRLPSGNTLVTDTQSSYVLEVPDSGTTVWEYDDPSRVARAPRYWTRDLDDFAEFAACLTGPGGGAAGCEAYDYNCDGDIDLGDSASFQMTFGEFIGP
ncbi:MAG: hypothetical protein GY842_17870 [bacterium]|nr:hypothetical protein [bacterium]